MSADPARARFIALSLLRLGGAIAVLAGLVVQQGERAVPRELGWVLIGAGLVAVFVLPQVLARRWRSPRK